MLVDGLVIYTDCYRVLPATSSPLSVSAATC